MSLVDYILDHIIDHMLDHMLNHIIISLVTLTLHKARDDNNYIVSNTYAKAKALTKGLILGGYKKINSKTISYSI